MVPSPLRANNVRKSRPAVTIEDLQLFKAITGRAPLFADSATDPSSPTQTAPRTIGVVARRLLTPDVTQLSFRLREIWDMGIANGLKRQHISDWLRHVSDEAIKRLEEAHERLSESRRDPHRHRVEAHEVAVHAASETKLQNVA